MYFAKDEIIELSGGKKHIIVDTTEFDGKYYYYVCEVNNEETKVIPTFKIITTISENGNLFVKTIKDDLANKLLTIFKEKLNIN